MARRTTMVVAAAARHYAWVGGVAAREIRGVIDFAFFWSQVAKCRSLYSRLASNASYGIR